MVGIQENDRYLIVGLGKTGLSIARFLSRKNIPFFATDSREAPVGYEEFRRDFPDIKVRLGEFHREDFLSAKSIVLSPGVPLSTSAVQDAIRSSVPIISDIELFANHVVAKKSVIAITGTNGKSTVTTLVAEMLTQVGFTVAKGGNLSPPALDLITSKAPVDFYVLELSSFQLETTSSLNLAASVILNVSEDHFDRYSDLEEYINAKQRIHRHSQAVVVNREEKFKVIADVSKVISFGLDKGKGRHFGIVRIQGHDWIAQNETPWVACKELSNLPGVSGVLNAQAALALGHAVGLPQAAMLKTLKTFKSLPHRLQSLGLIKGIEWINDSKATNVGATCAALATVDKPYIWIAGGDAKGADFAPLMNRFDGKLKFALLIGCDAKHIAGAFRSLSSPPPFRIVPDLGTAVQNAMAYATSGDCILLSPACSSLDCYGSYIERGNHFIQLFQEQTCTTG